MSTDTPAVPSPAETPSTAAIAAPAAGQAPQPANVSVFGSWWPGPGRAAPHAAVIGVAVTAIVAAAALSWDRPGVGWFGAAVAATMTVLVTLGRRGAAETSADAAAIATTSASASTTTSATTSGASDRAIRTVWAVLALTLLSVGAIRAAPWLWWLCLLTACLCGSLALVGGRSFAAMLGATFTFPLAVVRAIPWGLRGIAARGGTGSSAVRTLAAVGVGVVLLAVFAGLLSAADAAFASVVERVLPTMDAGTIARWVWSGLVVGLGTLAACFLALRPPRVDRAPKQSRWALRRVEWAFPVGVLIVLFGGFVAVQATVLFGGGDHVLATAGLTYAEYARQGFWQLLAVSALTLVVLAVAARLAGRRTAADRVWVRVLLGLLSVLSLVIVASALSRMWAYEQAYGFSRLRLLVSVCELWLGLIFVLVLAAGIRLRGRWVPRVAAQVAAASLVGLAVLNPDHFIATQNLARGALHTLDLRYLASLSADAVPALDQLQGDQRRCVLKSIKDDLDSYSPDRWAEWNLGRQRARAILDRAAQPAGTTATECWRVLDAYYR